MAATGVDPVTSRSSFVARRPQGAVRSGRPIPDLRRTGPDGATLFRCSAVPRSTASLASARAVWHALAAGGAELADNRGQGRATRRRRSDLFPCWHYAGAERPNRVPA